MLKIKTKLILGYVVISLLILLVTASSLYGVYQIREHRDDIDEMNATITALRELQFYFTGQANDERGFLLTGKPEFRTEILEKASQAKERINKLKPGLIRPEEQELLARIDEAHTKFTGINTQVLDLFSAGKVQEAVQLSFNDGRKTRKELDGSFNKLIQIQLDKTAVSKNREEALSGRMVAMIVASSAVTVLIGIILGFILARNIVNPINKITVHMQKGDLNFAAIIKNNDEIGNLTREFGNMVQQLRQLITGVQASAGQVAASAEQLSANSDQSAQVSEQIAGRITGVAQGADRQLKAVTATMEVVETMSASVQQIAANSSEATASAEQTAKTAHEGGKAVDLAISKMSDIDKAVQQSAAVVTELGQRSRDIGQIVDTIAGLAGQTNLLALNAAIEAARAGEQGRGFAVVAEEVRKLAEQSQAASKQIADLIGTIQADTAKAVIAMEDGTREVRAGSAVVNTAGQSFKEIISLVERVSKQIKDISQAINQVAGGSRQIVAAVREIDEISHVASAQTQSVSAAIQEQSATMEEIAASGQVLARLSEQMQQAVGNFKMG